MSATPGGQALVAALEAALARHRDAVLQAPPGAGKSTIVPLALLEAPWLEQQQPPGASPPAWRTRSASASARRSAIACGSIRASRRRRAWRW
jgi:ATP-dependent helicase HrpB